MRITKTRIVKLEGEYIARAYTQNDSGVTVRYPEADYFTDDKGDAEQTAAQMCKQEGINNE
jgi:hypothetical protein